MINFKPYADRPLLNPCTQEGRNYRVDPYIGCEHSFEVFANLLELIRLGRWGRHDHETRKLRLYWSYGLLSIVDGVLV